MNDIRLTRILKNRAKTIKGCSIGSSGMDEGGHSFFVEADTGAIFKVRVSVYKEAV